MECRWENTFRASLLRVDSPNKVCASCRKCVYVCSLRSTSDTRHNSYQIGFDEISLLSDEWFSKRSLRSWTLGREERGLVPKNLELKLFIIKRSFDRFSRAKHFAKPRPNNEIRWSINDEHVPIIAPLSSKSLWFDRALTFLPKKPGIPGESRPCGHVPSFQRQLPV